MVRSETEACGPGGDQKRTDAGAVSRAFFIGPQHIKAALSCVDNGLFIAVQKEGVSLSAENCREGRGVGAALFFRDAEAGHVSSRRKQEGEKTLFLLFGTADEQCGDAVKGLGIDGGETGASRAQLLKKNGQTHPVQRFSPVFFRNQKGIEVFLGDQSPIIRINTGRFGGIDEDGSRPQAFDGQASKMFLQGYLLL